MVNSSIKIVLISFTLFLSFETFGQSAMDFHVNNEKEIENILVKMTLEEKVGQTCQITLDAILKTDEIGKTIEPIKIDLDKLKEAIKIYKIGSILNVSSHTLGLPIWNDILSTIEKVSKSENFEIPIIYGIDAIHGVNYTVGATLFPQEIGLAATWNKEIAKDFGRITAYEARATGLRWNFSPVLDLGRQPLWSRYFETLGEDPYLCSILGEKIVNGYQGVGKLDAYHVASCLKHFVGYSASSSGRDRTPAWIPTKYMHELYLPSFKKAVEAGAMTLMINSGDVNGVPGHANKYLLTTLLKEEWGFKGFTVSDWEDYIMLETVHNVSSNLQESITTAFNAGVDMSMVPNSPNFMEYCKAMKNAVLEKQISQERLDDAVRRILRVKYAIGLFETQQNTVYPLIGSVDHKNYAYKSASESITLLKNEDSFLPLGKDSKILVAGPTANNLIYLNGAWTHTWQGIDTNYNTKGCYSIYEAIKNKVGFVNCEYSSGAELFAAEGWEETRMTDIPDFKKKAQHADVIVLCLGELPATEKPGDIRSLNLPEEQIELAKIAFSTGKPVILVLIEGRPRTIHKIVGQSKAIVQCYLPGDYGGQALADILFGDANPSGKLPYTYPKYDGVIEFYDKPKSVDRSGKSNDFDAFDPEWNFGFGLSYATFEYSEIILNKTKISKTDSIEVTVSVKNIGMQLGKEVIQLYLSDKKASLVPAGNKLKRFEKIEIKPGETKTIQFIVNIDDLKFVNENGDWILEQGDFEISIEKQKVQFTLMP